MFFFPRRRALKIYFLSHLYSIANFYFNNSNIFKGLFYERKDCR